MNLQSVWVKIKKQLEDDVCLPKVKNSNCIIIKWKSSVTCSLAHLDELHLNTLKDVE